MKNPNELADLRAENSDLRARLAVFETAAARWPLVPQGFAQPSESELDRLLATVTRQFPRLRRDIAKESFERQFKAAFMGLATFRRAVAVDMKRAKTVWLDLLGDRLREMKVAETSISLAPFTAAILAHGDIAYCDLERFPYDLAFGLLVGGTGRPAADAWRGVLLGRFMPATPQPPAQRQPRANQVQIRTAGEEKSPW